MDSVGVGPGAVLVEQLAFCVVAVGLKLSRLEVLERSMPLELSLLFGGTIVMFGGVEAAVVVMPSFLMK